MGDHKKLEGKSVLAAMRECTEARSDIDSWFYFGSKLWKAIRDHISNSKDQVLVDWPEDHFLPSYRGTGPGISMRGWGLYAKNYDVKPPIEASNFWIKVNVTFVHDEDRGSWEWGSAGYEREIDFTLNPPTDLIDNFTEDGFNSWISHLRRERDNLRSNEANDTLRRLITTYPEKAREILEQVNLDRNFP